MNEEWAWLLGVIVGDGHVSKYYVCISEEHFENLLTVKNVLGSLGFKGVITRDRKENRYRLWVNSKEFVDTIKRYGYVSNNEVPLTLVRTESIGLRKSFVRGLYDAEGSVEFWKPRGMIRINICNKSSKIIGYVYNLLKALGLHPYKRYSSKVYRIQIYRRNDVEKFMREIGFTYPTKIDKFHTYLKSVQT